MFMEQIKKVLRNSCSRQVIDIQTKTKESTPAHLHPVVFHLEKNIILSTSFRGLVWLNECLVFIELQEKNYLGLLWL